ncbi:ferritin-like fold-containing protein [Microterricola pindariensis]|uniref:Ferritin-like domain-containing protein n=1 Tax=Microterricola pindariensis TaxID=478010 RepID=A0ABX5AWQ6_9MICO|nr:ferritin-like fold-containing protein [Microterricola pindariensis]PPL19320.1 hypothetical protein GY24_06365 [Microterricola pindariensis]
MVSWFGRSNIRVEIPRLKARGESSATKVDFAEYTPELLPFLGQAAAVHLEVAENLARALAAAPSLETKQGISYAASQVLAAQHKLVAEIRALHADPDALMRPFAEALEHYRTLATGSDWRELLLTCYLSAGMLGDFFEQLARGIGGDVGKRVATLLAADAGAEELRQLLQSAINADPQLTSSLAMWGRRLVGDTLLVARSALANLDSPGSAAHHAAEANIEPVFTELIAAHTRRMDGLGLTA